MEAVEDMAIVAGMAAVAGMVPAVRTAPALVDMELAAGKEAAARTEVAVGTVIVHRMGRCHMQAEEDVAGAAAGIPGVDRRTAAGQADHSHMSQEVPAGYKKAECLPAAGSNSRAPGALPLLKARCSWRPCHES